MRAKTNNRLPGIRSRGLTIEEFLSRLDAVKQVGPDWIARCPAHDDGRPSLKISEGDRGIMVNCWAGCTFHEITSAMNIKPSQMFFNALGDEEIRIRKISNLKDQLLKIETRIHIGEQLMIAGTITDDERKALRDYIGRKIELQTEIYETEKM